MGGWGFVAAAYGIVWGAIVVYLFSLKRRYNLAATELDQHPVDGGDRWR